MDSDRGQISQNKPNVNEGIADLLGFILLIAISLLVYRLGGIGAAVKIFLVGCILHNFRFFKKYRNKGIFAITFLCKSLYDKVVKIFEEESEQKPGHI